MIAWYLQKGHSLDELLNLSLIEKQFYTASVMAVNEVKDGK